MEEGWNVPSDAWFHVKDAVVGADGFDAVDVGSGGLCELGGAPFVEGFEARRQAEHPLAGGFVARIAKAMRHEAWGECDATGAQLGPTILEEVFNAALLDDEDFVFVHVVMQRRPAAGWDLDHTE